MLLLLLSRVQLFFDPMDYSPQAPLFMGFPRQEYWSGLPLPSPGDLPNTRIKLAFLALQEDSSLLTHWGSPADATQV